MDKIWYLQINGKREGPFSFADLRYDKRVTPDTFVWKEGFPEWKKIRDVPELKKLFNDESSDTQDESEEGVESKKGLGEDLVIDMGEEPPYLFWVLIVILILTYIIIQLFWI